MANKVQFKGFRIGNGTKEVGSAETLQSALRNQGIATEGVAVLLNGGRVEEADLGKLTLRDGDVIQATVKAIGCNEGEEAAAETTASQEATAEESKTEATGEQAAS